MKNKRTIAGLGLVVTSVMLACVCASAEGGLMLGLLGKAIWYAPYAALVVGVRKLVSARG